MGGYLGRPQGYGGLAFNSNLQKQHRGFILSRRVALAAPDSLPRDICGLTIFAVPSYDSVQTACQPCRYFSRCGFPTALSKPRISSLNITRAGVQARHPRASPPAVRKREVDRGMGEDR